MSGDAKVADSPIYSCVAIDHIHPSEVVEKTIGFEKRLARRDFCEAISAAIVMLFSVFPLIKMGELSLPLLAKIGIIMVVSVTTSVAVLYWTRFRDAKPAPDSASKSADSTDALRNALVFGSGLGRRNVVYHGRSDQYTRRTGSI